LVDNHINYGVWLCGVDYAHMTESTKRNAVVCASCGLDILTHVKITWISCLASLSGEIEVYRQANKERLGK